MASPLSPHPSLQRSAEAGLSSKIEGPHPPLINMEDELYPDYYGEQVLPGDDPDAYIVPLMQVENDSFFSDSLIVSKFYLYWCF